MSGSVFSGVQVSAHADSTLPRLRSAILAWAICQRSNRVQSRSDNQPGAFYEIYPTSEPGVALAAQNNLTFFSPAAPCRRIVPYVKCLSTFRGILSGKQTEHYLKKSERSQPSSVKHTPLVMPSCARRAQSD